MSFTGCPVITGFSEHCGALTVSVAGLLSLDPASFLNTARNLSPDSEVFVSSIESVGEVAPDTFPPETSFHEPPPSVETSHWIDGGPQFSGVEADALNVAVAGAVTVSFLGCAVIDGVAEHAGGLTVSVAGLLSVDPAPLVNTARNSSPDSETFVDSIDSVCELDTLLHEPPPLDESCHSIDGDPQFSGVEADALNVAVAGAVTVSFTGCPVITGFSEHCGALTVSVAALLSVDPAALVNTARNSSPDSETFVDSIDSVCELDTLLHEPPPLDESCHSIDGDPQFSVVEADALNVAVAGAVTVSFTGCPVIAGFSEHCGALTVNVAGLLSLDPASLVNTARNSSPDSEMFVGSIESVGEVAPDTFPPGTSFHEPPPSVDTSHCASGASQSNGVEADASNVAAAGAVTI